MKDKCFIDSNICVYIFDNNALKKKVAVDLLLSSSTIISTQVIMETANVAEKKLKLELHQIKQAIDFIYSLCAVQLIDKAQIETAFSLHNSLKYSLYDSLIVSSAIHADCDILYTEDMQHNHLVNNKLKIINPFL